MKHIFKNLTEHCRFSNSLFLLLVFAIDAITPLGTGFHVYLKDVGNDDLVRHCVWHKRFSSTKRNAKESSTSSNAILIKLLHLKALRDTVSKKRPFVDLNDFHLPKGMPRNLLLHLMQF